VQWTRRRRGRLIIRCKNQRALLGRVFDPIGEATTGMGDSGCVDESGPEESWMGWSGIIS
jgi:hypothetical protein